MTNPRSRIPTFLAPALFAVLLVTSCGRSGPAASGMNLLVVTLDTTRADAVGLYSGRGDVTPNLDALGRGGVVFGECDTPVPLTLPAHASLFTGRYPIGHLVRNNGTYVLGASERTLAELFRERGFRTAAVIASFTVASKFGLGRGFESYDEDLESDSAFLDFHTEIGAERVEDKFVLWLDRKPAGPFFAWVHFYDAHFPYLEHPDLPGPAASSSWDRYLGEVRYVDRRLGRIVEALRARGLYESTVIVVVGDHGEAFGEHGEFGHGIFGYEESLRVPFVVHNPKLFPAARTVGARVSLIDVMPTVLDLFGIEKPAAVQGRSLRAALEGRPFETKDPFYFETLFGLEENNWAPLTGLIAKDLKYIALPEPELYDLAADRRESRNLAAERPEEARAMDRKLGDFVLRNAAKRPPERHDPSREDLQKLTALGYVSAFSAKAKDRIDPKTAIRTYAQVEDIKSVLAAGDIDQAERRLAAVLENAPGLELPALFSVSYEIRKRRGDVPGALGVLEKAMAAFPAKESFKISFVEELIEARQWETAAERCRRFLEEDERMTAAWILLGDVETGRGQAGAAEEAYRKALELEPGNAMVLVKRAGALLATGDLAGSDEILRGLESQPTVSGTREYGRTVSDLGLRFILRGDKERGRELLDKACSLTPGEPSVWMNLGEACFTAQDFDQALAAYAKALELNPDSAQVHSNIGVLLLARFAATQDHHLLDQALVSFDRAIRLDPQLAAAYMGRGSVHLDWGELAPAVRDFKRAIDLDAGLGNAYVNMALALQLQGKYSEAIGYLDRFKANFYPLMKPSDRDEIERIYTQIKVLLGKPR
jgi:arylsulfatase A-like enzyme/Flp pilus assembly protein TadD